MLTQSMNLGSWIVVLNKDIFKHCHKDISVWNVKIYAIQNKLNIHLFYNNTFLNWVFNVTVSYFTIQLNNKKKSFDHW